MMVKLMVAKEIEITEQDFIEYEDVRKSGATNMLNVKMVEELSGLDKSKIIAIQKNYSKLAKEFLP